MKTLFQTGFGAALSMVLSALSAELPDAGQLFERHFAAAGGRETLAMWEGAVVTGTVREQGESREFTLLVKSPGMILLTLRNDRGKVTRQGRDPGARLWQQDGKGVRELADPGAGELMAMSRPFHLAGLVEVSSRLSESAVESGQSGGRLVYALGRKNVVRVFPRLLFEADTGLLVGWGTTRFANYREVTNGIRVACTVKQLTRTYQVKSILFTNNLPDKGFERPGGSGSFIGGFVAAPRLPSHTQFSEPGKLEVTRRPPPLVRRLKRPSELPTYDPTSGANSQINLVEADLRELAISGRLLDLMHSDFSTVTKWPGHLPAGFDPVQVLELGKDPGMGVRALHARGITGKGIGIAIIDAPLLTTHQEFADRLRLYEEICAIDGSPAHMHGAGVAALALGRTCGVAPEAELYYISAPNSAPDAKGKMQMDWTSVARAINRFLEVNALLPEGRKIRVISMSMGWSRGEKGYAEMTDAIARASRENVFVISSTLRNTHQLVFDGLGREALADPNDFESYGPGSWWATRFWNGELRFKPGNRLCVPMDGRTTAGPGGDAEYMHYAAAGWSWSIPWIAGLYALACQVQPEIKPAKFWEDALRTGRIITLKHRNEEIPFGTLADPQALVAAIMNSTARNISASVDIGVSRP